ncbi:hypothetical protein [Chroogloeocystis siderophila]|uniref:hypothetical protein n=1 Tax=Chroogloeocystis siderophila TaxID=329163 RepID=UPI0015B97259|nr:hypothetical protein [Chroogloeocystis siderophila]
MTECDRFLYKFGIDPRVQKATDVKWRSQLDGENQSLNNDIANTGSHETVIML